jgi:putative ABC transport system permease protein
MNMRMIVWKELRERPAAMATSFVAIFLGVAAIVATRHVTYFSEREVSRQLSDLGANILVLPKSSSLQDYYSADVSNDKLPEELVGEIVLASLTGVEKLSPKLSVPAEIDGKKVTLTGILPQSEFEGKSAWQTANLMKGKHAGCAKAAAPSEGAGTPDSLTSQRTIQELGARDAILGADIAAILGRRPGESIQLLGEKFTIAAILKPSGTVDDSRVFAHLHSVQEISHSGETVSAIEVLGCCEDAAGGLVPELGKLLPDAKIVTISQVVETQVGVNRLMSKASILMVGVLVLVGGASVAGSISSNVRERRREIGTLMALGASPRLTLKIFLLKASWLGVAGGVGGAVLGTALAVGFGYQWAGVRVLPLPVLALAAATGAILLTLLAAYLPARQAAQLDPCNCFREV